MRLVFIKPKEALWSKGGWGQSGLGSGCHPAAGHRPGIQPAPSPQSYPAPSLQSRAGGDAKVRPRLGRGLAGSGLQGAWRPRRSSRAHGESPGEGVPWLGAPAGSGGLGSPRPRWLADLGGGQGPLAAVLGDSHGDAGTFLPVPLASPAPPSLPSAHLFSVEPSSPPPPAAPSCRPPPGPLIPPPAPASSPSLGEPAP